MRKAFAVMATAGLLAVTAAGPVGASHKSNSPHKAPAPPDCAIEVDFLGICLG